jgi:chaperonin GroES
MAFDPNQIQNAQPPQMMGGAPPPQMGGLASGAQGDVSQNSMPMQPDHVDPTQQPQPQPPGGQDTDQMSAIMLQMNAAIENKNLAKKVDEEELNEIGESLHAGYKADLMSCSQWLENNQDWLAMSLLTRKTKTFPWPNASNIKHPLLATASMQFSARAYPTLVPADGNIVKPRVIGYDPDGSRADKADRISKHMSFQIMHRIPRWEEQMDRLLVVTSLAGICFKKTYKDPTCKRLISRIVYPENLIVNYWAESLESAYRKTEIITYTEDEYKARVASKEWIDIGDIGEGSAGLTNQTPAFQKPRANEGEPNSESDPATPHIFLEIHTFWDVDKDDYAEPVVVTIHEPTKKVVRITSRFAGDSITFDDEGKKVVYIEPIEYYTDFPFFTNPDGSIYGLGFGALLGPINEAVNTLANLLIDSGTLANMQSGFIAKGLRIQMKETKIKPGEWISVNATGEDLKDGIFPLPTKEPSDVLFKLMQILTDSGFKLASVSEISTGQMPGQNTPATTTQESINQSDKVYTAAFKRMYNGLAGEFQKIRRLNSLSPDVLAEESKILGIQIQQSDYTNNDYDVIPAADPTGSSQQMQFSQLNQIGQQLLPLKIIDPREYAIRVLKLASVANPQKLIIPPAPPAPDPKLQIEQQKMQLVEKQGQQDMAIEQQKAKNDQIKAQTDQQTKIIDAHMKMMMQKMELEFRSKELAMEESFKQRELQMDERAKAMEIAATAHAHGANMAASEEMHKQKITQTKEMGAIKQTQAKKNGPTKQD